MWTKPIDPQSTVVTTDDPNLTGWVDPNGRLVALDARSGTELLSTNVAQSRLPLEEVRNLREPLLVADKDRFYLALNHPVDPTQISGGVLSNNFKQGIRSRAVNGWVAAFYRNDGPLQVGRKTFDAHKGELAWHSANPIESQLLVVEQFEQMPILLLTSRRSHLAKGGVQPRMESEVLALHKETGKTVYESGWRLGMNFWQFVDIQTDARLGVVNLIGTSSSVQFHLEDGRKVEPPQGLSVTSSLAPTASEDFVQPLGQPVIIRQQNGVIIQQRDRQPAIHRPRSFRRVRRSQPGRMPRGCKTSLIPRNKELPRLPHEDGQEAILRLKIRRLIESRPGRDLAFEIGRVERQ